MFYGQLPTSLQPDDDQMLDLERQMKTISKYPDQCQGFAGALQVPCRYTADALTSVRGTPKLPY